MSAGNNISVCTWPDKLELVVFGPPNPGLDPGPEDPQGYEAQQTALWRIEGTGAGTIPTWIKWQPMNAYPIDPDWAVQLAAPPCVSSWGPGRIDVLVRGVDTSFWHISADNGNWGGWEYLGYLDVDINLTAEEVKSPNATPVVVSQEPGTFDVFVLGSDGNLWHTSYGTDGWNWIDREDPAILWQEFSTPSGSETGIQYPPSAAYDIVLGTVCLAACGNDNNIYVYYAPGEPLTFNQPWIPIGVLEAGVASAPCLVSLGATQLAVFVQGNDDSLYVNFYLPAPAAQSETGPPPNPGPSSWRGWTQLGACGPIVGPPSAVAGGQNLIDVFAIGVDHNVVAMYMNWKQQPFPGGEVDIFYYDPVWKVNTLPIQPGVSLQNPPCAVSWGKHRNDVFAVDWGGTVRHAGYTPSTGWEWEQLPGVVVNS